MFQTGCDACAEAKPHLEAFRERFPQIEVEMIDLTVEEWPDMAPIEPPESIPSYALLERDMRPRVVEGRILTTDQLAIWVFK